MQVKKNPNKNLSKNSMLYFQIGLSIVLLCVLISAEWKSYTVESKPDYYSYQFLEIEQDYVVELPKTKVLNLKKKQFKTKEIVSDKVNPIDEIPDKSFLTEYQEIEIDPEKILGDIIPTAVEEPTIPYKAIQDVPIFPGCERFKDNAKRRDCMNKKLDKFIKKHFDIQMASEYAKKGMNRIDTQFRVTHRGDVQFMSVRAPHPRLEAEVKRIIEKLPKMQPGKQSNQPVNVLFGLPINFMVRE